MSRVYVSVSLNSYHVSRIHDLLAAPLFIGSAFDCDVVVNGVPAHWVEISLNGSGRAVLKTASIETRCDGSPVQDGQALFQRKMPLFRRQHHRVILGDVAVDLSMMKSGGADVSRRTPSPFLVSRLMGAERLPSKASSKGAIVVGSLIASFGLLAAIWVTQPKAQSASQDARQRPVNVARLTPPDGMTRGQQMVPDFRTSTRTDQKPAALPSDLERELQTSLVRIGIQSPVRVEREGQALVVTGLVSRNEAQAVQAILARVNSQYPGAVKSRLSSHETKPEFTIRSVSIRPAFVVLDNGRRVLVGDTISDGWVLSNISEREISIKRGSSVVKIARN